MLFKSESSLMAFSDPSNEDPVVNTFFTYLNFIESIKFETETKTLNQKSIGKSLNDRVLFVDPDLNINLSYVQRVDFLNETLFGFFTKSENNKSILYNYVNNYFQKNAFILFKDLKNNNGSSLIEDILNNDFNENLISIYFEKIFLNSYSFSYSYGSLPIATASFSAEKLKISKLEKKITDSDFHVLSDNNRYPLSKINIEDLKSLTMENSGRNLIYLLNGISLENQISNLQAPISNIDTFLSGNIDTFNLAIDLARNRFLFFEKTNETFSREFLLPCMGSIQFSGKTNSFTEKSLQDFIESNKKFSLKLKIGKENFNPELDDYTEVLLSNIFLENFSYEISLNGILNYSIKCSFEINESDGFFVTLINKKETNFIKLLKTSDGFLLRSIDDIFTTKN